MRFSDPSGEHSSREPPTADVALAVNGMGSFTWDLETGVMHYDGGAYEVMDFTPDEFDGSLAMLRDRMLPEEVPAVNEQIERALRERSEFSTYFRVRYRDGWLRWTHTQGRVVCDDEGRPTRVLGIIRDASRELRAVDQTRQLREERAERHRQADIIGFVNDELAPTVTVDDVAEALTSTQMQEQLGASSVVLGLVEGGLVRLIGASGINEELLRDLRVVRVEEQLPLADVVRRREPVFLTEREEYLRRYPTMGRYLQLFSAASAVVFLPLIAHDRPIGALGLTYDGKGRFSTDERTVLRALGRTIAQSLERAFLYDQEHELAAGLQNAMLPGRMPSVSGLTLVPRYRPARARGGIGGDWYDALVLPDGRVAAVIGDVQGHDVKAAAVMGQLRIALRAYAAEGHPAATVMARASSFLTELDTDLFATCLLVVLDPATGTAETVRAGHTEPLVRFPDGTCAWLESPGGLPLGLMVDDRPAYMASETVLPPGAELLLCTDGLLESRGHDIDEGRDLLVDTLSTGPGSPGELADHLLGGMAAYTGAEDDVALLVLRRGTRPPAPDPRLDVEVLRNDPASLDTARALLRASLHRWSMDPLGDVAELLACEMATNALRHTEGDATLSARPVHYEGERRSLRLSVADESSDFPVRRAATELSTRGRGLMLVEELAAAWGVEPRGTGKSVWCELS
ncbi:SpoIIE family protein phosphatase [Streptomyces xiaopingdaonensis]|uniref:SpoIIE family protein phosphatase n=1 Tax=Streptomyces xiaopingdaonensis TaxID=1565415 RepID=UPI0002E1190A|nr:SpoIIE family protein phosphatase [Streptomyces xiaopingdaonensis]